MDGRAARRSCPRRRPPISSSSGPSRSITAARARVDLSSPVVLSNIITYKGFKHLVSLGSSENSVVSVDADLGTLFFDTHLTAETAKPHKPSAACPGGMTANLAFPGNSLAPGRFGSPAMNHLGRVARSKPSPPPFTFAAPLYAVTADGSLHTLTQLSGNANTVAPLKLLPPMAHATGLNINTGRVYVATVGNCQGNPNGIYSVKLSDGTVSSFPTGGSGASGSGGTALGTDGVVYAQIASGHGEVAGDYNDSLLALSADKLAVQDYFTPRTSGEGGPAKGRRRGCFRSHANCLRIRGQGLDRHRRP